MLLKPVLILLEDLDIIISKAQESHQQSRHDHQDDVDIIETREEERRHENSHNDDDATHRRRPFLRLLAFKSEVTHQLTNLLATQEVDDLSSPDRTQQKRHDDRQAHTEGDISKESREW